MWATTTTPISLPTPIPSAPFPKLPQPPTITTVRLRRKTRHLALASSSESVGGLGRAVFGALEPGPSTGKKAQQGETRNELSGSDILLALQKASAKKANAKKQQKKKGSSGFRKENTVKKNKAVDYGKVRPITVKSDWATRIADLEKRLQEFSLL